MEAVEAAFRNFLNLNSIYKPADIVDVIKLTRPSFRFSWTNRKQKYFNVPCAFDIETTSFYRNNGKEDEKVAIMYEWTLGIMGLVIIGRTWEEFIETINKISNILNLTINKRLIIYVHNLAFEFQFIRKLFEWDKVFSLDVRKPVYAVTTNGIEFRCSYILSGYGLEKLGEQLTMYNVKKLVGDLDYSKLRHSKTPLTQKEIEYCVNDVKVVMAYIMERIIADSGIGRIPLTKTGYVRIYCRNNCFYEKDKPKKNSHKRLRYLELMSSLTLTSDEYLQLKDAFQGGFTHANPFYVGQTMHDVTSYDFTSSYPAVMVAEQFPMSKSEIVQITDKEEFYKNLKLYCCLFDIKVIGLKPKVMYDNYLSLSRCRHVSHSIVNNGRVVSADVLETTLTEQDFMIFKQMYDYEHIEIGTFRRYKKGYLPKDFVKSILDLYVNKTTLKDVEGKEAEYINSKEMLNACYGMSVTDIVRPEILYAGDWLEPEKPDLDIEIEKYNKSKSRFLYYPWGVWVTAYARRNLFTGICEFADDYIYSDTDSVKTCHTERHEPYIDRYNTVIRQQLEKALKYHGLDKSLIVPKTKDGVVKCLGVWDFDGHYEKFKTLGAKRYMVKYSEDIRNKPKNRGKCSLTVSGLNKKYAIPYMEGKYGKDGIFKAFSDNLKVPKGHTGKLTHTYIDNEKKGKLTDYLGNEAEYHEMSSVHMENAAYSLNLSQEYVDYLTSINSIS
jgi:hypothetical protein